jgi:hypothetical protein
MTNTTKSAYERRKAAPWADKAAIKRFYDEARRLTRETGVPHEVDHLYPISSRVVCGLHVPENLRITTKRENARKRDSMPSELADELWDTDTGVYFFVYSGITALEGYGWRKLKDVPEVERLELIEGFRWTANRSAYANRCRVEQRELRAAAGVRTQEATGLMHKVETELRRAGNIKGVWCPDPSIRVDGASACGPQI